jgi:hypothetical protein
MSLRPAWATKKYPVSNPLKKFKICLSEKHILSVCLLTVKEGDKRVFDSEPARGRRPHLSLFGYSGSGGFFPCYTADTVHTWLTANGDASRHNFIAWSLAWLLLKTKDAWGHGSAWFVSVSPGSHCCLGLRRSPIYTHWINEWVSKWMKEWVSEWVSEWMNELRSEWVNEWVSEWMN